MSYKDKVRSVYPKATHHRYTTTGHTGYTLIWEKWLQMGRRLGEGKTTAEAWRNAWKHIQVDQAAAAAKAAIVESITDPMGAMELKL